ncbi:MAG: NAD(P)/FAD-dependent oxidoreductase [Pseudanabaenaceae cyanobacterium bins.68]|nr:NAD(P)/FAD-dependent oxidoreductase [Pseudanabaenaceae cyanobacterium bins.68]
MMGRVVVIGGGAAGFFGAIACARAMASLGISHAQVILLEAAASPLAKVKISGGGRCNVTHSCFDPRLLVHNYPRGGRELGGAFARFQPQDTIAWFAQEGVKLKTEADGRIFPVSDRSETIMDCLGQAASQAGVQLRCSSPVKQVVKTSQGFTIALANGQTLASDRLLLATGSSRDGYRIAEELGHQVITPVPSLFTLKLPEPKLHQLAGVSVAIARLKYGDHQQTGALLITHWGMSGPAMLKLSAWAARNLAEAGYRGEIQINWLPEYAQISDHLATTKTDHGKRNLANYRPFSQIPQRLWQFLIERSGINPQLNWADLSQKHLHTLTEQLTRGIYPFAGRGIYKDEFVTCGGVHLKEVDFKTMASRVCPGLYLAGEVLDLDGVTGGFNFQSAWTTGYLAGEAIARSW